MDTTHLTLLRELTTQAVATARTSELGEKRESDLSQGVKSKLLWQLLHLYFGTEQND